MSSASPGSPGWGWRPAPPPDQNTPVPSGSVPPPSDATGPSGTATATRILYRNAALTDARSADLQRGISMYVEGGTAHWIRPKDGEDTIGNPAEVWIIDCGGSTIVPGLVDAHNHASMPVGSTTSTLRSPGPGPVPAGRGHARRNTAAGIRYYRDLGSPQITDPDTEQQRAIS